MSSRPDMLQATPIQLRSLIVNYLAHNGYSNTVRAFVRDSAVRHIDVDGDEVVQPQMASALGPNLSESLETSLKQAELRKQIRKEVRCGRIDEAIMLLNKYFPEVLSLSSSLRFEDTLVSSSKMDYLAPNSVYPSHLVLNLRIQAFIEACRTAPLACPPDYTTPESPSSPPSSKAPLDTIDQQTALLNNAQKLYAVVKMLPSEEDISRYMKELESVTGLLAYHVPEDSPVSEYLAQERREAVADQIDYGILYHVKRPVISYLELYARYTSTVSDVLNKLGVKPSPGMINSPTVAKTTSNSKGEVQEIWPSFNLQEFVSTS
ncbi:CTLH/CRA C-terminal to lish motif domain-containing protein [Lentinula lateritia]|uniref:CTLH/CRA C-terminal to lish motif domain-containing protein n=1 Tax=Lentinula aff. lateritia TaxID=2804960 RepID=A0ACC1UD30_9AGAR|nr:CTLH/CRA C-terminal to lish motif domain-containing protein [Lentinula aff. lateritia]KAJ3857058.1 CTLH/CRA C-terminal to lish motif domain-containing protein [Lentinula lateritia]